jgi:hypothetical protein
MTTEGTEEKREDTEKALYRRGAEAAERVHAEMHGNR